MSQPMPKPGQEVVMDYLLEDLEDRKKQGIQTYGTPLQTWNGRKCIQDAYEEALDLGVYLKQVEMQMSDIRRDMGVLVHYILCNTDSCNNTIKEYLGDIARKLDQF